MLDKRLLQNTACFISAIVIIITVWHTTRKSADLPPNFDIYTQILISPESNSNATPYTYPTGELAANDYNQLINLTFHFKIMNAVCPEATPILLLVLIHSAPGNFQKRRTVRQTWGGAGAGNFKLVFLLGEVVDESLQGKLDLENGKFRDLVQGNFLDSYHNLTYKHVMALKYAIYHCSQAKYILKTDDDVFVNMPTMLNFLTVDLSPLGSSNFLFCFVARDVPVIRSFRSKWRVSFKEYPARKYPTYCPGWQVLYSPDVLFKLYKEAQAATYFWIDDVLITGILAKKANLTHTDSSPFALTARQILQIKVRVYNSSRPFLFGKYNLRQDEIRQLWEYVESHPVPKSVINVL